MSSKMKVNKCSIAVLLIVTMVTSVLGDNRASEVCGDESGFNCLYQSNQQEYEDVPVHFDNPLPSWLTGTLIRNGLGLFERGRQSVTHVFDGLAKLSSWKFLPNGTSLFSTRFVRSDFYTETMSRNHLASYLLFNQPDPPFSYYQKKLAVRRGIDNMNINIYDFPKKHGDTLFAALSDYWNVYQVSGKNLHTQHLIKPKLSGGKSSSTTDLLSSAHPLPESGTTNRLTYLVRQKTSSFVPNKLSLVRMSSVSGRSLIAEWKIRESVPYMHSFSVTQTKAIMMTSPMVSDNDCVSRQGSTLSCINWNPNKRSILYIANIKTGEKKEITMTSSILAFHHINQGRLVIMGRVGKYQPVFFKL